MLSCAQSDKEGIQIYIRLRPSSRPSHKLQLNELENAVEFNLPRNEEVRPRLQALARNYSLCPERRHSLGMRFIRF